MARRAMDVYLNDHLAGATLGVDLAHHLRANNETTSLGSLMRSLAPQIEEDRQTLIELMRRLDISRNPAKQAGAWVAEKATRVKFGGLSSGDPELGAFTAVEALALGVRGKLSLWMVLQHVAGEHPALEAMNLRELIARAHTQLDLLEQERLKAGARALSHIHTDA